MTVPVDPSPNTVDVIAITNQIPEVNATKKVTICSHGGECDFPFADTTGLLAWSVMVVDPKTNIEFSFNTSSVNGRNKGKNRNRGNKKKKKNRNKKKTKKTRRGRRRSKQDVQRDPDDECPEGGWIMIVEGKPKRPNPHVILNKTCLPALPSKVITAFSNRAQVYFQPGNGQTRFELTAEASDRTEPSMCMNDCKWKNNEFSQQKSFWRIGGWNVPNPCNTDDTGLCVRIQFTMSLVPEELSCLNDCFSHVPKKDYKKKCRRGIQSATIVRTTDNPFLSQSDDIDIDCILFNRMPDPEDRSSPFSLSLIPEIGQRRRKSLFETRQDPPPNEATEPVPEEHFFSNFLPTEPLDRALIFCIMANLDARSKLLSPNKTGEFHTDDPIWNRNETCSSFLPKLDWLELPMESVSITGTLPSEEGATSSRSLSGSKRGRSKTRSSGPSSAIIERSNTNFVKWCSHLFFYF